MTKEEIMAKEQIKDVLSKQGYPTYAKLFNLFDVQMTDDPNTVGAMIPGKAKIILNWGLDIDQVSVIVRHEILHEYLTHNERMERHVGKDTWDKRDTLMHQASNIAGDYEISNKGYTDADKRIARRIKLNDQVLRGLVTEDDHPDWVNLSVEEMYDRLMKEMKEDQLMNINPVFGKFNSDDIQKAEKIQSAAQQISLDNNSSSDDSDSSSDSSSDDSSSSDSGELDKAKKKLQKKAEQISDAVDKLEKDASSNADSNKIFPENSADEEENKELNARLEKIKEMFDEIRKQDSLIKEAEAKISKEKAVKAARDVSRYNDSPLNRFKLSFSQFIRNEIGYAKGNTWSRMNKKYDGSGIIRPGRTRRMPTSIPQVTVYFDQSASWDEAKIKVGEEAVSVINQYVKKGEVKMRLKYFSNNVHDNAADARAEGGTEGQPILKDILADKQADNIIIMTDGDIQDCTSDVTVPGGVWILFKGGVSENLKEHIHGRKMTKYFDI